MKKRRERKRKNVDTLQFGSMVRKIRNNMESWQFHGNQCVYLKYVAFEGKNFDRISLSKQIFSFVGLGLSFAFRSDYYIKFYNR